LYVLRQFGFNLLHYLVTLDDIRPIGVADELATWMTYNVYIEGQEGRSGDRKMKGGLADIFPLSFLFLFLLFLLFDQNLKACLLDFGLFLDAT
jgi:hypothetical protein